MSDEDKEPQAAAGLDMDWGEALARFTQTKPEEVEPAPGGKRKQGRPDKVQRPSD